MLQPIFLQIYAGRNVDWALGCLNGGHMNFMELTVDYYDSNLFILCQIAETVETYIMSLIRKHTPNVPVMIAKRPYKEARPLEKVIRIVQEENGNRFDPEIDNAFLDVKDDVVKLYERFQD